MTIQASPSSDCTFRLGFQSAGSVSGMSGVPFAINAGPPTAARSFASQAII